MGIETCKICGKNATPPASPYAYLTTCDEHKQYERQFQAGLIRAKLGYDPPFVEKNLKCDICDGVLSVKEKEGIKADDILITCGPHRAWRGNYHKWKLRDMYASGQHLPDAESIKASNEPTL